MTRTLPRDVVRPVIGRATLLSRPPMARRLAALALSIGLLVLAATPAAARPSVLSAKQVQSQQWWITRLNLQKTWAISKGAGVTVAVLDTGVDASEGDLRGAVRSGFVAGGSGDGRTDTDSSEHGTRIADEIAGRGTGFGLLGVAPAARILPVTIPTVSSGTDPTVTALGRLASMIAPPQVVNMSFGTPGACPALLQDAVRQAVAKGLILVAAAGNQGDAGNPAVYPADCKGVVAVAAVDQNAQAWSGSERQPYVALAAPGVHMIGFDTTAPSGYGYSAGTSDGAAMVSGILAVLRAHLPTTPSRDLVGRVLYTARQFRGAQGSRNPALGYGVARPYNALTARVPADAPNPVYAALGDPSGSSANPPASGPASAPAATGATGTRPAGAPAAANRSGGGSNAGLIAGVVVAALVVALGAGVLVLRNRRRSPLPGPPGA
jgi:Subtilase family